MNNTQFRHLVLENSATSARKSSSESKNVGSSQQTQATPVLGSRARSSIPMTPRSVAGYHSSNDFARQLAEHQRDASGQPPAKRFKSTAAPKGTKLAQGYQDRTSLRRAEGEEQTQDDKEKRLKALEEMLKLQQIDEATFEMLRGEIGVGGDLGSTHLVKGLDWKLLERVKKGEDVNTNPVAEDEKAKENNADVEEELESALAKEMEVIPKEDRIKKGEMAPPPLTSSGNQKLSRNEILQRFKASRNTALQEPPPPVQPSLGDKFKKVGSESKSEKKRFTEVVNGRTREVLVITDKDGRTKRKSRWLDKEDVASDQQQQALGMEVPAEIAAKQKALLEQQKAEDDDEDIFEGIGADYDPLRDMDEDSGDESGTDRLEKAHESKADQLRPEQDSSKEKRRNYFGTKGTDDDDDDDNAMNTRSNLLLTQDPLILAALKRAEAGQKQPSGEEDSEQNKAAGAVVVEEEEAMDPEKLRKRQQFLERLRNEERQDAQDLDLGFGESRFGDAEEEDDDAAPVEDIYRGPTAWDAAADGDGDGDGGKGPQKRKSGTAGAGARKRGPKKRKGDKDNVHDVMSVLSGRK